MNMSRPSFFRSRTSLANVLLLVGGCSGAPSRSPTASAPVQAAAEQGSSVAPLASAAPAKGEARSGAAPAGSGTAAGVTAAQGAATGSAATESAATPPSAAAPQPPPSPTPPARCPEGMVLVAGGEFKSSGRERAIGDLCVDQHETTAAAYAECVAAGRCNDDKVQCSPLATYGKPDRADHPMVCVTFAQARDYCAFRDKRLPTTYEWEWVARGGAEARRYPWGDEAPQEQVCWSGAGKRSGTCAVGQYPAGQNVQGIQDLAGNVLEFTTTELDATSPVRIARGGSWRDGAAELLRAARVGGFEVTYRCAFLGIRCVTPAPENQP